MVDRYIYIVNGLINHMITGGTTLWGPAMVYVGMVTKSGDLTIKLISGSRPTWKKNVKVNCGSWFMMELNINSDLSHRKLGNPWSTQQAKIMQSGWRIHPWQEWHIWHHQKRSQNLVPAGREGYQHKQGDCNSTPHVGPNKDFMSSGLFRKCISWK